MPPQTLTPPLTDTTRLSPATRALAERALGGEFGRDMVTANAVITERPSTDLSPAVQYAEACRLIAERAPLRLVEGELIVGSATLLEAAYHTMPVLNVGSTSHTTLGFDRVLREGYGGVRRRIDERLARGGLTPEGTDLLEAMLACLDAAQVWRQRYVDELVRVAPDSTALTALRKVPEHPPGTFHEALQSLWFMYAFQRLCGNWSGLGRLDCMLWPYLEADLAAGTVTLDQARELIAHFWIKGCEWIGCGDHYGGDAQFYQNVILGGVDEQGREVTNEVTWLILDVVEELHISDFPIAVRLNQHSPAALVRRIAEVQRQGGGIVSVYNEDIVIPALRRFGYTRTEACSFTNDGCWEVLVPGQTKFGYAPFDALQVLQDTLGLTEKSTPASYDSYEDLHKAFLDSLRLKLAEMFGRDPSAAYPPWRRKTTPQPPLQSMDAPLVSMFVDDCIERARGYNEGGPRFTVRAPHAGGLPDVANSLYVIDKVVYEENRLSLEEFVAILAADWEGHEQFRAECRNRYRLYGNDNPEADALLARIVDEYITLVERLGVSDDNVLHPAGISTFGREIGWRDQRAATPFGSRRGDILATNLAPTPGTDSSGPTAVIRAHTMCDFTRLANGTPLELKLHPSCVTGSAGLNALEGIVRTFLTLGGFYLQIDVVDRETLLDAQTHPERHTNLAVRISGWSARFTTLSPEWQQMIIERTEQRM